MARKAKKRTAARPVGSGRIDLQGLNPFRIRDANENPFELRQPNEVAYAAEPDVHIIRKGVRCDTEGRGHATPRNLSPTRLVVHAPGGFIPLWAPNTTVHWRFRESSMQVFQDPEAAKSEIAELMGEAILAWGEAAPVKFTDQSEPWDFEVVMRQFDDCDPNGCVLASAFFPDAGRHTLELYPRMFRQDRREQVETLIHEIGHIFGLRHFFAPVAESSPAEIFGTHVRFSIMNYGEDSRLTDADKSDLMRLYQLAWEGQLTNINGTPIRFVKPFHTIGESVGNVVALGPFQTAAAAPRTARRR